MKKIIALGFMTLSLFATSVEAETKHCHTLEDCRKLKTEEVEADLAVLLKDVTPELTGVLSIRGTQTYAKHFCEDKGMRLPTAREFALVAESLGAEGISETRKDGYRLIRGQDSAGNPDYFYFSNHGYKRPAGALGNYWFWSSSVHPGNYFNNMAYLLNGYNGAIDYYVRSDVYYVSFAVRCAID